MGITENTTANITENTTESIMATTDLTDRVYDIRRKKNIGPGW